MKKRSTKNCIPVLVIAAAVAVLFSSCGGTPGREPTGLPVTGAGTPESPAVTSAAPSPTPAATPSEKVPIPESWRDDGIFSDYYERAYWILETMSAEEKIGQMLLARRPQVNAQEFIQSAQPGGFVLFEPDFRGRTADDVIAMLDAMQDAARIPLIIATDEEGGSVVRISRNPFLSDHIFRSPQRLFAAGGFGAVHEDALAKAALLKKLGLNLNLAPVADVSTRPGDFIYPRTLGQPAAETGDYVAAVVTAMGEMNMSSALKHFPGYGSNSDTHTGIAVDDRPYSAFAGGDFIPFLRGIEAGAECILMSHNMVQCMDAGVPASLSPKVHAILRNELGFTGIILTDDLGMGAVKKYAANEAPSVLAVLAGNDMLVLSDFESAYASIREAVRSGVIPMEMIDRAVFRILSWKLARGIMM